MHSQLCCIGFACSAAKDKITANYVEITNLPIDSILGQLLAKKVILSREKEIIESKLLQSERMEHLLDKIIIPSLKNGLSIKFKGFLEVLEDSGDSIMIDMAQKLGMQ